MYDDDFGGDAYREENLDSNAQATGSQATGLLGEDSMAQNNVSGGSGWSGAMFDVNAGRTTKNLLPKERLAELKRREERAAEIEKELSQREKKINKRWTKFRGEKNWPFPFWRLAHHNIKEDIPEKDWWKVRRMYFLWCLTAFAIFWNWLCFLCWLFWPDHTEIPAPGAGVILLSSLYLVMGLPGHWLWIYKKTYNTFSGKMNKGKIGTRHFVNFGVHILFVGFMCVGIEDCASGGLFVMIKIMAHQPALGMLFLIDFVLFAINLLASLWLFRQQRVQYGMQIVQDYVEKNGGNLGGPTDARGQAVNFMAQQAIKNPDMAKNVAKGALQA